MDGLKGYVGTIVEKTGDLLIPTQGDGSDSGKSRSFVGFLTKTALLGGVAAGGYYLGKESTKPRGVLSKILNRPRVNKALFDECILHCYDHCPYCIRVELALTFLGVPYTREVYGYGDFEGPKKLTGKKQLPVLEHLGHKTPESLDIIDILDANTPHRSIPPKTNRSDLDEWLRDSKGTRTNLTRPRVFKVPVKDWANIEDTRYATQKYEKLGFNYSQAKARTADLIVEMNEWLEKFSDKLLYDTQSVNEFGFGMDDILVIPHLRTLTCVKGLKWPDKLRKYLENSFEDVKAELYFKHAIE